jgi:hypothetical protein
LARLAKVDPHTARNIQGKSTTWVVYSLERRRQVAEGGARKKGGLDNNSRRWRSALLLVACECAEGVEEGIQAQENGTEQRQKTAGPLIQR